MTKEKLDLFKSELKELLEKYDASFCVNIDGDQEGISDLEFVVQDDSNRSEHILSNHAYLEIKDL